MNDGRRMDVIFEIANGKTFSIEVGFFDTILEFKEKVQKYQGIPILKQTLMLNGQVLKDEDDVWKVEILQNTRIQLHVSPDSDKPEELVTHSPTPPPPHTKIHLNVKTPSSKTQAIPLEVDLNDTVLRLKERIHEIENVSVPVNRLLIHASTSGAELQDHQVLRDCDISDNSEIEVSLRPVPSTSSGGGGLKKLRVYVLPNIGARRVPVEVNPNDNVGELRKELQKCSQRYQFHLPPEGYFFIFKQNVMDDDMSFRWHHVGPGDTIEMFKGSVTGGS